MHTNQLISLKLPRLRVLILVVVVVLLAGCGGGSGDEADSADSGGSARAGREVATMPVARFAAPTTMIDATKVAESDSDATPEPEAEPDLAFGEEAYVKLCVECHADDGEGVADKAETIVGLELEDVAFVELLRTGGGYGNEHIFGTTKISDDGIVSLLAYVRTLTE